ncbi:MAG: thiolase C-terminal domain-containing protein [Actinomycetota bacterium]
MRRVAVAGCGQTHHGKRTDLSIDGLVREAIDRACEDASIELHDVDAFVLGTAPDFFEGIMQPEQWLAGAIGASGKPVLRVHTAGSVGGSTAVVAASHVASELFDVVLAVAFEKHSESDTLRGLSPRNPFGRTFGAGAGAFFAPYIRLYIDRSKAPLEIGPRVAVKARSNGARNPYAHLRKAVTLEEVLESPMLWDPVRRFESCPTSDGAAAMVFVSEQRAGSNVAWVRGAASMAEAADVQGRDVGDPPAGRACAKHVYAQAGIEPHQLNVAEIYEPFSWIEVMWYENLGFCGENEGWKKLENLPFPVNPSGGVLCTNPIGASGILRMAEAAQQVRGRCGEHQVDGATLSLGHAYGGASNYFAMMIFGAAP